MKEKPRKLRIPDLYAMRDRGEKLTFLTAYDYPMALLEDKAGIELMLVGDSLAMTVLGYDTTLPMTMDEMIVFTKAVTRAARRAFVIGDMPYMTYQITAEEAIYNAGRFMAECATDAIKLEGGTRMADKVEAIVQAGIPVMGHIGLTPQYFSQLGGFRAQGRDAATAKNLVDDALAIQEAGAFSILLECIPARVAQIIHQKLDILVLSLGSGPAGDGQMMIVHDMLGLFEKFTPKFVKQYVNLGEQMVEAFGQFIADVRAGRFPQQEHLYHIPEEEFQKLQGMLK